MLVTGAANAKQQAHSSRGEPALEIISISMLRSRFMTVTALLRNNFGNVALPRFDKVGTLIATCHFLSLAHDAGRYAVLH
jgi:hypothetical protein